MAHQLAFLIFPDFQLLDAAGPIAAFEVANGFVPGAYSLRVVAAEPGCVRSSSGVTWEARPCPRMGSIDTLLVAGGDGVDAARRDARVVGLVRRAAARVPRLASVCSGALLLAEAGALAGRRATTHYCRVQQLTRQFPDVSVEPDSIWTRDGHVWTSAGISAGIDLALALIGEDLGARMAREVARHLVLYAQRPGHQTQRSALLELDASESPFADLNAWMRQRLDRDLRVEALAAHAKMSPRTFARAYLRETGVTPAKAVERLRLEAARNLLADGQSSLERIAERTGFGQPERMRRAFVRAFGAPPSALRNTARRSAPHRSSSHS
ncbi:GlxA family transcriptional regulator [Sorangium sp. So ce1182]|uniref:GlxA family transcriptional regulator n=1 Tax=Sorangium sp. So ce1182 TaxID=3133334 RepID=UPI003F605621